MSLASPPSLLAALGVAVLLVLLWRASDRRRRAALERFAALQLLPDLTAEVSLRRRGVKRGLLLAAIGLGGLALAGPQYGFTWEETQRRGIDVLIAVDTSRSMLAQDVAPNRLERAKLAIIDLVEKLGGDRVGLIAFAGTAFLQCPLTLDHGAFLESLQALQPGVIPAPGSDLASALHTAEEALQSEKRNVKLLVLFSDGEDLGGGALAAARQAAEQGIRVFTVGVGSDTGELIPLPGSNGGTEFLKGPDGQFVKSRLDADTLRQVAELTGGFYEPLGRRGEAVAAIYDRALAPLPKEELASRMRRVPIDRYQWPLALALLCLTIELLLGERRGRGVRGGASAGAALIVLALAGAAHAASPQEAARLYDAGEYDKALEEYRAATAGGEAAPSLDFNLGAAAYKAGEFGDAATAFARALRTEDPKLQEQGFYNLGNAQFRVGQQTVESDPQQTMQAWQQALDAYESALKVDPTDADATFNRDFVKHALEELQKQQQQKQDQQKNDEKNEDQEKKDQEQQSGEQNQEQQDQQQQAGDQKDEQKDQQQAKQDQGEQPQDQQKPEDQQKQKDQQQAKAGEQEDQQKPPEERDGTPESRNQQPPPEQGEQTARAPQQPQGQMSPAEAKELLDSLKDGEATLQELQANQPRPRSNEPERDW